jgi:hypothetical protein
MLKLTDDQMDAVLVAARPLAVEHRDAFLKDVAEHLMALPHFGELWVARRVQRECYRSLITGAWANAAVGDV